MRTKLDPIKTNSKLSLLAVEIAEKFRPIIKAGGFTQTDLALAIQQGIDKSAAKESYDALVLLHNWMEDMRTNNPGYAGKLVLDFGLMNDAFIAQEDALRKVRKL